MVILRITQTGKVGSERPPPFNRGGSQRRKAARRLSALIQMLTKRQKAQELRTPELYFIPARNGYKRIIEMSIHNFDSNVYSEEIYPVSEIDYNEVMSLMADEQSGFEGYGEWSQESEQGQIVETRHGAILINKECVHSTCHTTRCEKAQSFQGIAI
jgi:hypothetical protein